MTLSWIPADLRPLRAALEAAWRADTGADPSNWHAGNRAYGQCVPTALIVQDRYGGDLLRTVVDGDSHYYNSLADGRVVDLTADQFPPDAVRADGVTRSRGYVLGSPDVVRRYQLLSDLLAALEPAA